MQYKTMWLAALLGPMLVNYAAAVETKIATGPSHTLFVDNGAVFAMGANFYGQVQTETPTTYNPAVRTPVLYEGVVKVKSVAAGNDRSAALHEDGTVSIWGRGTEPTASTFQYTKTFPQVAGASKLVTVGSGPVTDIAFSNTALYYIQDGIVYKHAYTAPTVAITKVNDGVAKSIAAGVAHVLVMFQDGSVASAGANTYGQLGLGSTTAGPDEITKINGVSNIVDIAAGRETSFAKTSDGMVYGWGRNTAYQMGDGTINNYFYPVPLPALTGVKKILGGGNSTIGLMDDGTVRVAGFHNYISSVSYNSAKTWKVLPEVTGMKDIAAGWGSSNMVTNGTTGVIQGWSMNRNGELGDGTTVPEQHKLVTAVFTPVEPVVEPVVEQVAVVEPAPVAPAPTPVAEPAPVLDTVGALPFLEPQAPPPAEVPVAEPTPSIVDTVVTVVSDAVTAVVDAVVAVVDTVVDTVVAIVTPVVEPQVVVIAEPAPVVTAPVVVEPAPVVTAPVVAQKCNNGFGNGDQCAPGNSLMNNNAENAQASKGNAKSSTIVAAATSKKK
jgi:alpha-tubulin suppressor-like RCC1 family protein